MNKRLNGLAALAAVGIFALTGCSAAGPTGGGGASGGATSAAAAKRACVVLPDAVSSGRWENGDRQALDKAFTAAGVTPDIQNAQNDTKKFATIAQQQLTKGCAAMLLVDLNGAGAQVVQKAHSQGVPVIAYDRPIQGADYYVSFDNFHVGELQGQLIVDGLKAKGKDPKTAKVVYVPGDPVDGNAKQFLDGANSVMSKAGIKPVFKTQGTWLPNKAQTFFEQAYTALKGNIDAVWAANDANAAAAISVLNKNGKTVVIEGQDGQVSGLQYILLGKQVGTVFKPFTLEADAASKLAIDLTQGKKPTFPKKDTFGVPFQALQPIVITQKNVQEALDKGAAKYSDVCAGDAKAACTKFGIKQP
ncbi:MAG: D-xylose transport system substrate-binding protein [Microbacteriaceae bacterium]|nr:D-xylose transport system substrate-binding protein [Microbacteriaceae bacterium]